MRGEKIGSEGICKLEIGPFFAGLPDYGRASGHNITDPTWLVEDLAAANWYTYEVESINRVMMGGILRSSYESLGCSGGRVV